MRPGLVLASILAPLALVTIVSCHISVGDQSCTESSNPNDKDDACPYGPPGGPKLKPAVCPPLDPEIDPANCTTTWENDIFPLFTGPAGNCSVGGCHGDAPGAYGIHLPETDPSAFFDELKGYKGAQGYPYINPDDAPNSWIICNLAGVPGGGSPMPKPSGMDDANLAIVTQWVKCGMPRATPDGGP